MSKKLIGLGIVLIIVVAASRGLSGFLNSQLSTKPSKESVRNFPTIDISRQEAEDEARPSPPINKEPINYTYKKPDDPEGRSYFYSYKNPSVDSIGLDGIGFYPYPDMPYIVGQFSKVETISGSNDKYLFISDPLKNQPIEKVRLLLAPSDSIPMRYHVTLFGTEYLTNPGAIKVNKKWVNDPARMAQFVSNLKPEYDAVVALLLVDSKTALIKDSSGALVAEILSNRRL